MNKGGMGSFVQVENNVLHGPDLLWLAVDGDKIAAAGITQLSDGVCTIVAVAGEYSRFGHLLSGIEQFARNEGCNRVRVCGRPGWRRRLTGYRTKKVILEKAI